MIRKKKKRVYYTPMMIDEKTNQVLGFKDSQNRPIQFRDKANCKHFLATKKNIKVAYSKTVERITYYF